MDVTEQENRNMGTIATILQSFGTGNTDKLDELIHDDFKNHNAPEGLQDKAGFYEIVKMVNGAFSSFDELDLKPAQLFAKGDSVAMMDLGTGKRKGKVYTHKDIHIFKMKDGKMYEHWNSFGLPSQRDLLMNFLEETN
ncbi:MAG: ester cyclase [Cyclobacteriaceae bacterium]